ncbi:MAG TPA: VOC family protein [Thermomicrobiales bacterium]|nr:VOC family protein [Thermomicrobiales bacterium]
MATPIRGLGEIALQVNDMDAMVDFYERVVGLELLRRFPGDGPAFFRVADGVGGHTQVLALFDRATRPETARNRPGMQAVPTTLAGETTHDWVQWRSLYAHDPEGNEVEWVCFDPSIERAAW